MRMKKVFWAFLALLTLAWALTTWLGWQPPKDVPGTWWWQLRHHGLYLTGVWSVGMMSLIMLLALRQPWQERLVGGLDQVYRLHKWAGIAAAIAMALHYWGFKEFLGDGLKATFDRAGKPARDAVLSFATEWRGLGKDVGEWAMYALLALIVLTLWQKLLPYKPWRKLHRVMPVLYLAAVFHTVALMPLSLWAAPMGVLMGALLAVGSGAALWSLLGKIGQARQYSARIDSVQLLGQHAGQDPLEVLCALPPDWPGHHAGQFVFVQFDGAEGHHPFTIASAPGACGQAADGAERLRLVIKPLGDYTQQLHQQLQVGHSVRIEGPYGRFDGQGVQERQQVWIAGGVGVTPFIALLEARQPGRATPAPAPAAPAVLHYCTRAAANDGVLPRIQALAASAQPPVELIVHDAAKNQYFRPQDLLRHGKALDIWLCGPAGLGQAVREQAQREAGWHLHQEAFQLR